MHKAFVLECRDDVRECVTVIAVVRGFQAHPRFPPPPKDVLFNARIASMQILR